MKIVFMGYQAWGARTLQALSAAGHQIDLVMTHPDSHDAYESLWGESVRELAESGRIPVIECETANSRHIVRMCARCRPDLFVMSNWRRWLSPEVYKLARHGAINIHDALLPRYGGFAPINWAVAAGEHETGVTVHLVDERLDTGDILVQKRVPIGFEDTATDIYHRTLPLFPELIVEAVAQLERGTANPMPQNLAEGSFFHKRTRRELHIDWQRAPTEVYNLVRAQSAPYPSAFTFDNGEPLEILSARLPTRAYRGTPGRIMHREEDGVVVLCGGDSAQGLLVRRVRPEGGEAIPAERYFKRTSGYLGQPPF
jgi:methionyl-tRNA formyltransferase